MIATPQTPKNERPHGKDRVAYMGIGIYSLVNIAWIIWAFSGPGFGIFHSAGLIGAALPLLGLVLLIGSQGSSPQNRFSLLANILALLTMGGWFVVVWLLVGAASASI